MTLARIFKAYDVRGLYPEELNEDVARRIGAAFADHLGGTRIAVGRDCRASSPSLVQAFTEGATGRGSDVVDIGLATTDMLASTTGGGSPGQPQTRSRGPSVDGSRASGG